MKKTNLLVAIAVLLVFTAFHQETRCQQTGTMTDNRDGKIYKTVTIGNQIWMAQNLNYNTSGGSWCYNNIDKNCEKYGRLYNWKTTKEICPSGWHIPENAEWDALVKYLGGDEIAGGKLKSNSYWATKHDSITNYVHISDCGHKNMDTKHDSVIINNSGFSGLPGGGYYTGDVFDYVGIYGNYWSSTEYNIYNAWYFSLYDTASGASKYHSLMSNGFSVRCIKD